MRLLWHGFFGAVGVVVEELEVGAGMVIGCSMRWSSGCVVREVMQVREWM